MGTVSRVGMVVDGDRINTGIGYECRLVHRALGRIMRRIAASDAAPHILAMDPGWTLLVATLLVMIAVVLLLIMPMPSSKCPP